VGKQPRTELRDCANGCPTASRSYRRLVRGGIILQGGSDDAASFQNRARREVGEDEAEDVPGMAITRGKKR
jgi:hypothetical protein